MTIYEQIKSILTAREVVERYGYPVNRAGFISCPFHKDKTASLKVYDGTRGWACFGCGLSGSVIDFVMNLFDLSFNDAVNRINTDFCLHLAADVESCSERSERVQAAERAKRAIDAYHAEYDRKCAEHQRLWLAKMNKAPKSPSESFNDEYIEALKKLPALEYWFEVNPYDRR